MKTYAVGVGIGAVAILLVATGIGFGIAQAGGTHSERPVLGFEEMTAGGQGGSVAGSRSEDFQPESPIETGAIRATGAEEPWMKEYGHD